MIASNGGALNNPDWYFNLNAQPNITIDVGTRTIDVTATEATGEERQRLFRRLADDSRSYPNSSERRLALCR